MSVVYWTTNYPSSGLKHCLTQSLGLGISGSLDPRQMVLAQGLRSSRWKLGCSLIWRLDGGWRISFHEDSLTCLESSSYLMGCLGLLECPSIMAAVFHLLARWKPQCLVWLRKEVISTISYWLHRWPHFSMGGATQGNEYPGGRDHLRPS